MKLKFIGWFSTVVLISYIYMQGETSLAQDQQCFLKLLAFFGYFEGKKHTHTKCLSS